MKKIFFWKVKGRVPFWQPWGIMGCLGRFLLFLLLLLLLLFLLSLFRKCDRSEGDSDSVAATEISDPTGGGEGSRSVPSDPHWNEPIPGGEEVGLPAPDDNVLPPFEETIPNPETGSTPEIYPNLLYVIFDSDADDETFKTFARKFSSLYPAPEHKIAYYNTGSKTAVLQVPEDSRIKICDVLPDQITEVEFLVVPVELMTDNAGARVIPDDPAFSSPDKSWYFQPIQAPEAWTITRGSADVIVGIVDSFMDLDHPELKGDRCIFPYSVPTGGSDVAPPAGTAEDAAGHGTLVTAIAVGNADNNEGSSGIAPRCRFIPVSMGATINTVTQVEGLLFCMYHGASVINISSGSYFPEEITGLPIGDQISFSEVYGKPQERMWNYVFSLAEKRNVTIVWAAGNQNCYDAMDTSKRDPNTIRVSAVDRNLRKANFSNFGNFESLGLYESSISAPGVDIWGALPGNRYDAWPGTSFSAPIITGVVALIKSQNKDLTTRQIMEILKTTGKPVAGAPEIGNLVQIYDALVKARSTVASGSI